MDLDDGLHHAPVGEAQLADPAGGRADQQPPLPRVRDQLQRGRVGQQDEDAGADVALVPGIEKTRKVKYISLVALVLTNLCNCGSERNVSS